VDGCGVSPHAHQPNRTSCPIAIKLTKKIPPKMKKYAILSVESIERIRSISFIWIKTTLKACKILCEKSGDIGNYREAKRRAKIGMYKKMHSIIEKEKGGFLVRLGFCHVLATNNTSLDLFRKIQSTAQQYKDIQEIKNWS
ncbi:hypothetical protein COD09_25385, partial [Bacillus cereus]